MTYEDEVIKAARDGYAESLVTITPELEKLLRLIYNAGYNRAQIDAMNSQTEYFE